MKETIISTIRVALVYVVSSIVALLAKWGISDPALEIGLLEIAQIAAGLIFLVIYYLIDSHLPWLHLLLFRKPEPPKIMRSNQK